ncbi:ABC transporter permease [Lacicoccus qingdaonensis]|uniref:ABC-2 type transport system permease protein n=1 Tax=Lacicoccus qingdaonensis TaxID=576118 RepID=A0A1G9FAS1_9BACL|nr:ABC transporter permease [Salinicoccus qingdaonensis]SDK85418.1 ABC-2 type transport system permease protein [Salinicoccus qingdaonensis]
MSKLFSLIKNELGKIFVLKSTWIMYVILAGIIIASAVITSTSNFVDTDKTYSDDWKTELQEENEALMAEIEEDEDNPFIESTNMGIIEENEYHIENDVRPYGYHAGDFTMDNLFLTSLISLFTIIVGGGIVANEFRWGTIKQLLIRPISRSAVLLSKYIALLIFTLFTVLFLILVSAAVGALFYGLPAVNPEIVVTRQDGMATSALVPEALMMYGFRTLNIIILATFAFMISSIFRSSALAIGLAMFLMFAGSTAAQALARYEWSKFILFANTDLSVYFNVVGPIRDEMTIGFSTGVIIVYVIIFIIAAWMVFTKRDVA